MWGAEMGGATENRTPKKHPDKALTAIGVRALKTPGRYADGNGLYLKVSKSGAKRWELRTMVRGKRCDIGLGGLKLVSLAEARDEAEKYRKIARNDGDPLAEKRRIRQVVPTFKGAAESVHKEHAKAWKNGKHSDQWINTLKSYAYPAFGDRKVDQVLTADILKALTPIWLEKPETARRLRQRIGTVLDWAKAAGFRSGDNPVADIHKALPRQPERKGHFTALPYTDVPAFVRRLREDAPTSSSLAFEFLILTAARTGEVLEAKWSEIDLDQAAWTIPADRMKAGREHRVPLPPRCLEILGQAKELAAGSEFVFAGRSSGKPNARARVSLCDEVNCCGAILCSAGHERANVLYAPSRDSRAKLDWLGVAPTLDAGPPSRLADRITRRDGRIGFWVANDLRQPHKAAFRKVRQG